MTSQTLFACLKTVNIWRMRQVIKKLKSLCRFILIWCSTEIKTRQRIVQTTAISKCGICTLKLFTKFRIEIKCEKDTCKNGGTCIDLPKENSQGYQCKCQEPFYGKTCEKMFKGKFILCSLYTGQMLCLIIFSFLERMWWRMDCIWAWLLSFYSWRTSLECREGCVWDTTWKSCGSKVGGRKCFHQQKFF